MERVTNNIDKDIERVKEIINNNYLEDLSYLREENDYKIFNQAIENVLSEFQALREFSAEEVINTAELQVELKTYKKIAEKLAEEMVLHGICSGVEESDKCYANEIQCGKCIIDWARKEVENEQNN